MTIKIIQYAPEQKKQYNQRWIQAVRTMERVVKNDMLFSMHFFYQKFASVPETAYLKLYAVSGTHSCKSVACMIGYISHDPWHNKQGFTHTVSFSSSFENPVFQFRDSIFENDEAVTEYFGISAKEAAYLFEINSTNSNITAKQALRRLQSFVKNKGIVVPPKRVRKKTFLPLKGN